MLTDLKGSLLMLLGTGTGTVNEEHRLWSVASLGSSFLLAIAVI